MPSTNVPVRDPLLLRFIEHINQVHDAIKLTDSCAPEATDAALCSTRPPDVTDTRIAEMPQS